MDIEIIPIAIPLIHYELHIAKLIETLLVIDEKLFPEEKYNQPEVA